MNNALQPQDEYVSVYIVDTPYWEDEILADDVHTEAIVIDTEPLTFPGISVSDFMRQTAVYEEQPAPFAARLRQGTLTGMALTLAGALSLALLPAAYSLILANAPFLLFHSFLSAYMQWLANAPLLRVIDGALLSSSLVLLIVTRGLQRGKLPLHWLAFVEALGGSANLLMIVIPLAIICLNVAVWIILALLIILLVALIIAALVATL